jgi:hypothetical protein
MTNNEEGPQGGIFGQEATASSSKSLDDTLRGSAGISGTAISGAL